MQRENDSAVDYYMKSETDVKFELAKKNFWISISDSDFNSNTKIRASRQNIFFFFFSLSLLKKKNQWHMWSKSTQIEGAFGQRIIRPTQDKM